MPNPIEIAKPEFENVLNHLEKELHNIRSGRANAAIVEEIKVEAYGSFMELKGLASISSPDAKTIQIEPWDKTVTKEIEKALIAANLGMAPNVAGTVIRLVMPPMTEENRRDTVKVVHQKGEQAHISIRGVRESVRDAVLKQEKDKQIGEDERFRLLEDLDKVVAEYNNKIDAVADEKEEEVMTV
ncbi:MAG: ribosome recycling factor [Patescibacteria group bacterium]